jgi:uncharacterized protein (TIGR02246 family)
MQNLNRSFGLLGAAAVALFAAACQKQAADADPAAVQNALKADEKKWNEDFKAKNGEALIGHYADDAYFVTPGGAANGRTAIRKVYSDALPDHYFSVNFASDKIDVSKSGDLAYARGHFSESYQDPKTHQVVSDSGSYITVYKKQDDGSWKAVEDFATADPATRKTAAPKSATGPKMITSGF